MKKRTFLLLIFCICSIKIFAQIDHKKMFEAYLIGELNVWGEVLKEKQKDINNLNNQELAFVINYQYGYIPWCLETKKTEQAKQFLGYFESNLSLWEQKGGDRATIFAYRSGASAFRYKLSSAISHAISSIKFVNKAFETDKENPIVLSLKGNIDFYKPAIFGGSKKEAMNYFIQSLEAFERINWAENNWNYVATKLCLAQTYEKTNQIEKAIKLAEEMLSAYPNFLYLKNEYYPFLLQKK
ncbi:MAG: hypothetical protein J6U44_04140 [Paludibacteraceae bacterium]|nr:hypothetical protein [Paludibacteraceae bacterium]MBO7316335.1 hypothetical protein [Paludibacteraceae bacterium]